ncbi:ABC transporter ATP-binding protein [Sedimentibacter sp. zth1]|uniref:ATP-binding cassette domain-containing protein n=1 Tax=Sedimentibacter sp. zth1 TaxID=2816908 RepID=UPI001A921FE2|nr:ABC transporter ATP-binding protein [Sedimentibacter sp. zth1]QSX05750.1 ABC transporter ATP-binding protein [Sedimentibacter sp. zth1]
MKNKQKISNLIKPILMKVSITSCLLKLISVPIALITANLMSNMVTNATNGNVHSVIKYSIYILSVIIIDKLFSILATISFEKKVSTSKHKCKMFLYKNLFNNPLNILYDEEHGKAIELLNDDFNTVTDIYISTYPRFIVGIITSVSYFVYIFMKNKYIAYSLLIISLVQLLPPLIIKKYMQQNYDASRGVEAELTEYVVSSYKGFATIKLYGLKNWYIEGLKRIHKKYIKIGNRAELTSAAENSMTYLLENILQYGTYGALGLLVLFEFSTLDIAIVAIALSGGLYGAVSTIFNSIPEFAVSHTALKRLAVWFDFEQQEGLEINNNQINLKNVCYEFEEKKIMSNTNVSFDLAKLNVIKGENGIGKSTLLKLMLGILVNKSGEIRIGGIKPTEIKDSEWCENVLYLPQDDININVTPVELYSSIADKKFSKCIDIASEFGLTDKILKYSVISELSGGERKKVYLSLVLALESTIMILDEPTNSLDSYGKDVLIKKLVDIKNSRGAVIVTHDDKLTRIADRIYTFDKGGEIYEFETD